MTGISIVRPSIVETTAQGAAFLAAGSWLLERYGRDQAIVAGKNVPSAQVEKTWVKKNWSRAVEPCQSLGHFRIGIMKRIKCSSAAKRKEPWDIVVIGGVVAVSSTVVDAASRGYTCW